MDGEAWGWSWGFRFGGRCDVPMLVNSQYRWLYSLGKVQNLSMLRVTARDGNVW